MPEPVSEERQKAFLEKARKGMLTWLDKREGGTAPLGEMHDYSAERYLLAHQGFSKLMEGLVDDGLIAYDRATMIATLTDAGRRSITS